MQPVLHGGGGGHMQRSLVVLGVRRTWRHVCGRMRRWHEAGRVVGGVRRREPCGRGRMQRIMPDRVRVGVCRRGHGQCRHMLGDVWRQDAGRGGGVRRREYRERRRVLIIVHDRGGVLVRALCGAAVSVRGVWGLVHARMWRWFFRWFRTGDIWLLRRREPHFR